MNVEYVATESWVSEREKKNDINQSYAFHSKVTSSLHPNVDTYLLHVHGRTARPFLLRVDERNLLLVVSEFEDFLCWASGGGGCGGIANEPHMSSKSMARACKSPSKQCAGPDRYGLLRQTGTWLAPSCASSLRLRATSPGDRCRNLLQRSACDAVQPRRYIRRWCRREWKPRISWLRTAGRHVRASTPGRGTCGMLLECRRGGRVVRGFGRTGPRSTLSWWLGTSVGGVCPALVAAWNSSPECEVHSRKPRALKWRCCTEARCE